MSETQTVYDYTYDTGNDRPNRLTDFEGTSYSYDANGHVTVIGSANLYRDYKGQIEYYEGSKDEFYDYDAGGLRVYKQAIEDTTYIENFDDGDFDDGLPTDWYTTGSNWEISSGELLRNSVNTSAHLFSNPDITYDNFTAEFDLKADDYFVPGNWAGFSFRKSNYSDSYTSSGYTVYYKHTGWIYLYEAGYGPLSSSDTGLDLSAWRHVKIDVSGSTIKVYVNGNLEINHTDGTYSEEGYFGFVVSGLKARFDDLEIRDEAKVHYVRDAEGKVLAEYNDSGDLLAEYVYANGQRIAKLTPSGGTDIYLNDHLGSARAMARSGWSANYYAFGEIASQTGSNVDTRFDFTGQERDEGTGLMYYGARYYDPVIGRFLSVDALVEDFPGFSPYNYTFNNPTKFVDPDGRSPELVTLLGQGIRALSFPLVPVGVGGLIEVPPEELAAIEGQIAIEQNPVAITVEDIPVLKETNVFQERTPRTKSPKKTDPKTAEQAKKKISEKQTPDQLKPADPTKNRPPGMGELTEKAKPTVKDKVKQVAAKIMEFIGNLAGGGGG